MFSGSFVALVTPFTEARQVDEEALVQLIEWHIASGTDGIVCLGTTAETPTLSQEEQIAILKTAIATAKKRVPIIAGTGFNDTKKTVKQTEIAQALGADGCLVILPYYNRPTPEGCLAHFKEIAEIGLPIIVYTHAGRTGIRLPPKTLRQICALPSVVGLKEGPGDLELAMALIAETKTAVFSGDDASTLAFLASGANGVFSIVANLIPAEWKQLIELCLKSDFVQARALYYRYHSLCKALVLENNPQPLKWALYLMGKCAPHLRLPLVEPTEETKKAIEEAVRACGLLSSFSATYEPIPVFENFDF